VFGEATARLLGHDGGMIIAGVLVAIGVAFWGWRRWQARRLSKTLETEKQS